MIKNISLLAVLLIAASCGKPKTESEVAEAKSEEVKEAPQAQIVLAKDPRTIGPAKSKDQLRIEADIFSINSSENPAYGYWVGMFGKNKINIAIAEIEGDSIFGHSVCAGNFRAIKGTVKEGDAPGKLKITMREPGDDKYDGQFDFVIDVDKEELSGSWVPYKYKGTKTYTLSKINFEYDPNVGDHPEASTTYLEVPDVENLLPEDIEMIRNEIYARHGYSFTNLKIRRVFDEKDWYIPMGVDIRDQLTEIEAHNIDLLYNYEDYYDEYYNDYGR